MRSLELPVSGYFESRDKEQAELGFGYMGETKVYSYHDQRLSVLPKSGDGEQQYYDVKPLDIDLASLSDYLTDPDLHQEDFHQELAHRRGRAKEYGHQIAEQRIRISELIKTVYAIITTNDDFSVDELYELIATQAAQCRLTPFQIRYAFGVVETIARRRDQIDKFLIANGCGRDNIQPSGLFHTLTGNDPVGKVEIELTPITIHVCCFSEDDYMQLYEDADGASSGGVALINIAGLPNIVTAENASNNIKRIPIETGEKMTRTHWQCKLDDIEGLVILSGNLKCEVRIYKGSDGSIELDYAEGTIKPETSSELTYPVYC